MVILKTALAYFELCEYRGEVEIKYLDWVGKSNEMR